jgi:uncharacterized membrane protein YbhN (UPF0104 family)
LYLVFRKINLEEIGIILQQAHYWWLIPALLLLLVSKTASAFRLDVLLRCIGLPLGKWYNTQLCFIGMYYNLFLPGGIGGDGYKIYFLRKNYETPLRPLLSATLIDRLSGVIGLGVLVFMFVPPSSIVIPEKYLLWVGLGWILIYPTYYFLLKFFFPAFLTTFWQINGYSLLVQGIQVICVITILLSLNVNEFFMDYAILFLLSSIAAMLPITIGGAGTREAVLLFLPGLLKMPVDTTQAVTMSLLFFLINVMISLPGAFIQLEEKQVVK